MFRKLNTYFDFMSLILIFLTINAFTIVTDYDAYVANKGSLGNYIFIAVVLTIVTAITLYLSFNLKRIKHDRH